MYKISDYGINKHIDNDWFVIIWTDTTQLTAYNRDDAEAMFRVRNVPDRSLVIYNPDGTIYKAINTDRIPDWDPTLRWGVKTPKEAQKMIERRKNNEKDSKPLFKLF